MEFDWTRRPHDFNYPEKMQAHDQWTYFLANALGRVAYIQDSLALYRRHENAVTGSYDSRVATRARAIRNAGSEHYAVLSGIAQEYAEFLRSFMEGSADTSSRNVRLREAIEFFLQLGRMTQERSMLHSGLPRLQRLGHLKALLGGPAYFDIRGKGMGGKALVKDLAALL